MSLGNVATWIFCGTCILLFCLNAQSQATEVKISENKGILRIENGIVAMDYNLATGTYDIIDLQTNTTGVAKAHNEVDGLGLTEPVREANRRFDPKTKRTWTEKKMEDGLGQGKILTITSIIEQDKVELLATFTVYEGKPFIILGSGITNRRPYAIRVKSFQPLMGGDVFPGLEMKDARNLNGAAGSTRTSIQNGTSRACENNLLLTFTTSGQRRSLVAGGITYQDFGKYVALGKFECWNGAPAVSFGGSGSPELSTDIGRTYMTIWRPINSQPKQGDPALPLQVAAVDPVGKLVEPNATYQPNDLFYLDVSTSNPFIALENYGYALRIATKAHPNTYNNLTVCGWFSGRNNAAMLVEELDIAKKLDMLKTIPVAVRLEPDTYCFSDNGNTEQGWWDDEHWSKYKHLTPPYDTFKKWIQAVQERRGTAETYFQCGMPSDDYAETFPGHMLRNDISQLHRRRTHTSPSVTYDVTDPDFQKHMRKVWANLKDAGLSGVKFDYPDLAWRVEGGFEDKSATTAFAYRTWFQLCRDGLGPNALLHERALGPACLDVTAGIVDLQRVSGDNQVWNPSMAALCGLRWYKNRVVFNYYPDSKAFTAIDNTGHRIENVPMEEGKRRTMITMLYTTSSRIESSASLKTLTPEAVHDISRAFPMHSAPQSARPVDAFTGIGIPRVYVYRIDDGWSQVTLYNTDEKNPVTLGVPMSGDQATIGSLGLDADKNYYVYEFWSDRLVGRIPGSGKIEESFAANEARMYSVREVMPNPQVLSTNRHLMQGYVDLENVKWDAQAKRLSGTAKVVGGEAFRIAVANNGFKSQDAKAEGANAKIEAYPASPDLQVLVLECPTNSNVSWSIRYSAAN